MPTPIKMPALSPTMEEGTLARWLVKEGDTVSSGDIMAEIETDKATMEFEAVDEGVIAKIEVPEGTENVKVGTVIAILAEEDEDVGDAAAASADEGASEPKAEEPKDAAPAAAPAPAPSPAPAPKAEGDRIIASPLAKRIAEQKGIDLSGVTGSGPNGRIVKADVEGAKPGAAPSMAASAAPAPSAPQPVAQLGGDLDAPYEAQKLNNVRKVIARRLTEAKQTIPHIYLTVDVRLDALLKLRGELNKSLEADGVKLSVNDLLIKASAIAIRQKPTVNSIWGGDKLYQLSDIDVSVAVAIEGGLITPIIRKADQKGLATISAEMKDLATRAKAGKLKPEEFQGGGFSLSNLGMFGIKEFSAVINPPQASILAVGAGEQRPVVKNGALAIATVMSVTLSVDHRVVDGALGAEWLQAFKKLVEDPISLML